MVCLKPAFLLSLFAALAVANPVLASDQALDKRQGVSFISKVTCGDNTYARRQLEDAAAEGCRLYFAREQVGSSEYPHRFNNRENLHMPRGTLAHVNRKFAATRSSHPLDLILPVPNREMMMEEKKE
ncbi:putative ribonuclease [Colletotrichum sublineola]|uniref:Putative ribonuclease n=1 Tax=Colletotrichum sublineola TaxID=1173701 RepID=A0A066XPS5_COLSU|nr:putative ribonuclease [Colletotrichum sublineola]